MNILLGVVLLGFLLTFWMVGQSSGPEGPVGAWIVPVPFILILAGVLTVSIVRGRFAWLPGGKPSASLLAIGFMTTVCVVLVVSVDRESLVFRAIPFVMLAGCFWLTGLLRIGIAGPVILVASSLGGYGVLAAALVSDVRDTMAAAEQQVVRERAEAEAQSARALREFQALAPDASLLDFINLAFVENETVQREVRTRIVNWPDRDQAIAAILSDETLEYPQLICTVSYIAYVHPAPPATLAPAFARAMDRSYPYWESSVRNSYYASKYEPQIETVIEGGERIVKAGGDLHPQLSAWRQLAREALR